MTVPTLLKLNARLCIRTLVIVAVSIAVGRAAPLPIKLGTLVPSGTSYHKALMALGETWSKDSKGAVTLRVYAGGKAGGEAEMVGLMMANNLQAALLTGVGLAEIDRDVTGLQYLPMAFRNLDELDYVSQRLQPDLEERLRKKGFIVLFWTDAGWIRFFSKKPVEHPADLQKLKLFSWAGDAEQAELAKLAGFHPVLIETADIVPSLQTGLIEAVPLPPFYALASQVDVRAPHMLDLDWTPLVGACVVRAATWEKLPEEMRKQLMEAARKTGEEVRSTARRESSESVAAMRKRGLKVLEVTPELKQEWQEAMEKLYPSIRGRLVPAEIFDRTLSLVAEYRAKKAP
ncbi:C4-dicarboxylate ABC transporter substrate-binding protein [Opitutaceae bacterium EW11]|nr:C4-dicarboxylate ABC transporter substrate-binding protein [Opitutaceae bacterium EW11]